MSGQSAATQNDVGEQLYGGGHKGVLCALLFVKNIGSARRPRPQPSAHVPRWVACTGLLVAGAFGATMLAPEACGAGIEVTVQTTGCSGETGFASFPSERLFKISEGWCSDPNDPGTKLQQVFLKSDSDLTQYDLLWVTADEARSILEQVKEIRTARIQDLKGPEVVVEKETVIREARPSPPPTPVTRGDLPAPVIYIIDPPVGNIRAVANIITPERMNERLVVARVNAPAGLLSLTVNGQQSQVDDQGLFKATLAMQGNETPVTIVAVDKKGKRSVAELRLVADVPQPSSSTGDDADFFGTYHALIIANNDYTAMDDLATPINDAETIGSILEANFGFRVTRLYNADRYEILSALNEFRRDLTEKDNLLIYYAGHGEYDETNNRGHWLPVDAEPDSTANWVSTSAITDTVNAMSTKHVLVVADSCYSGSLTRSATTELDPGMSDEMRNQWLRTIAGTRSRYVLTSGGVKPVLDDSGNGHSVFANALIDVLRENSGVLEGTRLYREVKERVEQRAQELNVEQVPRYSQLKRTGHEYGEFLLIGRR